MCGIAGWWQPQRHPEERQIAVAAMVRALWHRGPDAQDVVSAGEATLGVARLAIVDRAHGHQPMARDEAVLAYNGELYNHAELRRQLEQRGHVFRTASDTEVVLAAHATWGNDAPTRFDGMFAYALWQPARQELLLVRDRFGKKPLYYSTRPEGIYFGSELKCLRAAGVPTEVHTFENGVHATGLSLNDPLKGLLPELLKTWLRVRGVVSFDIP